MKSRLPRLSVNVLDDDQRRLYNIIVDGPRAGSGQSRALLDREGCLTGPFNAMLYSPPMGDALQAMGLAIRFGSCFSERSREIAILTVASHLESAFEWETHETLARQVGVTAGDIRAIQSGDDTHFGDAIERCILRTTRQILQKGDLTDKEYRIATGILGSSALFELTTLVGYYALLALQLRLFRVGPPLAEQQQ